MERRLVEGLVLDRVNRAVVVNLYFLIRFLLPSLKDVLDSDWPTNDPILNFVELELLLRDLVAFQGLLLLASVKVICCLERFKDCLSLLVLTLVVKFAWENRVALRDVTV